MNNRWPSSILSTACHGSEIKILEPFLVVIVRLVVSVQQHVFVLTAAAAASIFNGLGRRVCLQGNSGEVF